MPQKRREDPYAFMCSPMHRRLLRFLRGRRWHMKDAEKQLRSAIEWRREKRPSLLDCRWCHERAGYHALVRHMPSASSLTL